jgi:hypothetical protein
MRLASCVPPDCLTGIDGAAHEWVRVVSAHVFAKSQVKISQQTRCANADQMKEATVRNRAYRLVVALSFRLLALSLNFRCSRLCFCR